MNDWVEYDPYDEEEPKYSLCSILTLHDKLKPIRDEIYKQIDFSDEFGHPVPVTKLTKGIAKIVKSVDGCSTILDLFAGKSFHADQWPEDEADDIAEALYKNIDKLLPLHQIKTVII